MPEPSRPLLIGSLFSGVGGLELGLEAALGGGRVAFQVERDPFCSEVLTRHWPLAMRFDDVRDQRAQDGPGCDVLCGGFPCQPHSLAGARKGNEDERHLWPDMMNWVRARRPSVVVAENVPGLLTSSSGEVFSGVLSDLHAGGYDVRWRTLAASDVGAPHRRKRLFIVARRRGAPAIHVAAPSPPDWSAMPWPSPPRRPQSPQEPPRVIAVSSRRVERLKAMGNAVVPLCGYEMGAWVREALAGPWAVSAHKVLVEFSGDRRHARQPGLFDEGPSQCPRWSHYGSMRDGLVRVAPEAPVGEWVDDDDDDDEMLWPTPRATESEMRTYAPCPTHGKTHGRHLQAEVIALDGDPTAPPSGKRRKEIGALNPDWVEMLMGFRVGWTSVAG